MKTDVTVFISGGKHVAGCPKIFHPKRTKTTTSPRDNRHEKRQTRRADQGAAAKNVLLKSLISRMTQRIVRVSKIHHDHSTSVARNRQYLKKVQTDLTADVIDT